MKKSALILAITAVAIGLAAVGYWLFAQRQPAPQPPPPAAANDEGSAPLHPLMIDAIRARSYAGSPITVEREVGAFNGYTSQVVSYRSDGFKVFALKNTPSGPAPAGGWPVIILNHGYIPPQQYRTLGGDYQYWVEGFTRAGYVVLKPDYRGHGDSEGTPEGGHWSPNYAYDTLNLIASLKSHAGVDAKNIGLVGHSMGGMVVLRTIVATADVKASAILAGVEASAPELYSTWRRGNWSPPPGAVANTRQKIVDSFGEPNANPDFWNKISAINYVKDISGSVQIHHGTADDTVPIAQSASLDAALSKASRPHEYFVYQGGDHQFNGTSGIALQRMLALFNSQLKM